MTRSYYSWFYFLCVLQVCFKDLWFLETGWLSVFSVHAFLHVCAHESTEIDVRWRCIINSLLSIIPSLCKTAWEHLIVKELIYKWQLFIPTQWICICVTEKRTSWLWGYNFPNSRSFGDLLHMLWLFCAQYLTNLIFNTGKSTASLCNCVTFIHGSLFWISE